MLRLFVKSGWTVNENNTLHFYEACYLKVLKDFTNYVNKPPSPASIDTLAILEMSDNKQCRFSHLFEGFHNHLIKK